MAFVLKHVNRKLRMDIVAFESSGVLIALVPFLFLFLWLGFLVINPENSAPKVSSRTTRIALGAVIVTSISLLLLANKLVEPKDVPLVDERIPTPLSSDSQSESDQTE